MGLEEYELIPEPTAPSKAKIVEVTDKTFQGEPIKDRYNKDSVKVRVSAEEQSGFRVTDFYFLPEEKVKKVGSDTRLGQLMASCRIKKLTELVGKEVMIDRRMSSKGNVKWHIIRGVSPTENVGLIYPRPTI